MSHQQSSLELGTGVIENVVDIYEPERFIDLTDPVHKLALKIEKRPQDIDEEDYLFVDYLEGVISNTGSYQLSPFSFNWNHLHRIYTILSHFQRFTRNIPLSSCRLDEIARDPGLAQLISKFSGSTNITSAVEGISERICNALEKSLSNEEFIQGIKALIQAGFNGIKIYFIYTGMENDEDVKEFNQRLDIINQFKHQFKNNCAVRVSFTPLHSTLGTPTAYHGSKVAKSLKSGDRVFRSIRASCSQHNIGIRLSASLGSVDVGQMLSMTDRRTQPLIEYLGLNGVRPNKFLRVLLYVPERELTEEEYMATQRTDRVKIKEGGKDKFYKVTNTFNFSTERLFREVNENWMYPKMTTSQIERAVLEWNKANPSIPAPVILEHMQPTLAAKFAPPNGRMLVEYVDSPYTHAYTPELPGTPAKPINALLSNRSIEEHEAEDVKRLFQYFTGGQTFNDVIQDKSALHLLPDSHMIIADSRHPGWQFSKYIGAMRASLTSTYCHSSSLAACLSCGQCQTNVQIRSVSAPRASMETGYKYLDKALTPKKSYETAHRLMVALQIKDGPYSAMYPAFIRHAMHRALLKGALGRWTKPLIYDRSWNSRTPYTFREANSKSSISGQMLFELQMNYDFEDYRQEDLDRVVERAQQFTTEGWQIEGVTRIADHTMQLAKVYDTVIYQFLIDTRETAVNTAQLIKLAERIKTNKREKPFQVATHKASGRDQVRIVAREVPAKKINDIFVQRTMSPFHISMTVITSAINAHPQSLLSALLSRAVDPRDERIGQSGRVQPHTTRVLGYYKRLNVQHAIIQSDADGSIICPYTGETKLINIVTGRPFGSAEYEKSAQYPDAGQTQFFKSTPMAENQWWPETKPRIYL